MVADITGILYGLWYNFRALFAIEPICEFEADTRPYHFVAETRGYNFPANTRPYHFVAEDKCA